MSDVGGLGTRFGMALVKCRHNFCLLRKTIIFFRPRVIRNRSIKNNSDRMCDIIARSHKKKASFFFFFGIYCFGQRSLGQSQLVVQSTIKVN
jgi:hypothetical protein